MTSFTGNWTVSGHGTWATGCTWTTGNVLGSVQDVASLCGPACLIVTDCVNFVWTTTGTNNNVDTGTCTFLDNTNTTGPIVANNHSICGYNSVSQAAAATVAISAATTTTTAAKPSSSMAATSATNGAVSFTVAAQAVTALFLMF
ncbi:hypothetical protein HDU83_005750 [Entophlyctis luteolus]|nr:hypothetical protein HDU82_003660 [Entophlyctis luteolus]KAJ3354144.1 hypothetical protein HDU83_005750 [Entophlyctis luteolus]